MQIRKERVAIAKKGETVSVKKVPIVESLVADDTQGFSPDQLDKILPQFAQLVASAAESEAITRSRLHELLHQSIDDVLEEDSFAFVEDEGHVDPDRLVKDLKNGIITINGDELKVYRCSKTGLLMVNLTEGLTHLTPGTPANIPKAHRSLRAMVAVSQTSMSVVGTHSNERHVISRELKAAIESDASVVIVTRGNRFGRADLDPCGRKHLIFDVQHLEDPARDAAQTIHVGWTPGISRSLIRVPEFNEILKDILDAVSHCDNSKGLLIEIRCKSGRHRSVCAGFCSLHQLRRKGHSVTLVHHESPEWVTMKCGGTCSACRDHNRCLAVIEGILPARHDGPILAPGRPQAKALPKSEARDVGDGGEGGGSLSAFGDPGGTPTPVSVVDGLLFSPKHFRNMQKTMNALFDKIEDLREEVAATKTSTEDKRDPYSGVSARPDLLDSEALNAVVELSIREGNRDRMFCVCNPEDDISEQQSKGVRMACFIRTTMTRKHRKTALDGRDALKQHDLTMQSSLGMKPMQPVSLSTTAIVTSHPILFQDTFDNMYVVGVDAENLDDTSDGVDWQHIFDGCSLVVVAIEYRTPETHLNHARMMFELESYCDATGCSFLLLDVAHTQRWEDYRAPQVPNINEMDLAYVCNDSDLISAFGQAVVDSMSVAFPAAVQEEAEDQEGTDVAWNPEDLARSDPVEDLITEETLLDDVDVPGLPEDETERRRAWRKLAQRVRIAVRC
eukprot:s1054_g3.t1